MQAIPTSQILLGKIVDGYRIRVCPSFFHFFADSAAAGVAPVLCLGIIKSQFYMVLTAGFCQFVYDITFERGVVYDIEFAGIAFEHRESVMVFGGEYDILHTCIFGS